jgi:hypothetical protein
MYKKFFQREFVIWWAVIGTAVTLIGAISPLLTLANWLRYFLDKFVALTSTFWNAVFALVQLHIPIEFVKYINLAVFIVLTSLTSAAYQKTYLVEKVEIFYDLFKSHIVAEKVVSDRSSDFDYLVCFALNAFICVVVFRDLYGYIFHCLFISCDPASTLLGWVAGLFLPIYVPLSGFLFAPNIQVYAQRLIRASAITLVFVVANYASIYAAKIIPLLGIGS